MDVEKILYGTDDAEEIYQKKSSEKQIRSFAGGNSGKVKISSTELKKLLTKMNNAAYFDGDEERVREYVVTDETVDRYGDIVRAKGVGLINYKKNPVVQFAHDYEKPPIGMAVKVWYDNEMKCIRAWTLFHNNEIDPSGRSDLIFRLAEANRMRACSIGFMPIEVKRPATPEEREKIGLGPYGVEFLSSDMMEFSPCPVPANPNALEGAFVKQYREEFMNTLRSGLFTQKDVETIRTYPLFATDTLDAFIKELGQNKETVLDGMPEDKAKKYSCECIDCGHTMESEKHCKDIKCPECGGTMRRAERPGPGQESADNDKSTPGMNLNINITDVVDLKKDIKTLSDKIDSFTSDVGKKLDHLSSIAQGLSAAESDHDVDFYKEVLGRR